MTSRVVSFSDFLPMRTLLYKNRLFRKPRRRHPIIFIPRPVLPIPINSTIDNRHTDGALYQHKQASSQARLTLMYAQVIPPCFEVILFLNHAQGMCAIVKRLTRLGIPY